MGMLARDRQIRALLDKVDAITSNYVRDLENQWSMKEAERLDLFRAKLESVREEYGLE